MTKKKLNRLVDELAGHLVEWLQELDAVDASIVLGSVAHLTDEILTSRKPPSVDDLRNYMVFVEDDDYPNKSVDEWVEFKRG